MMSVEGTLKEQGLTEVLHALARRRRTGILTVQGNREIIALSFLEGEVVSADALNLTLEDGLGKVLADMGLVSQEDFAGLAAEHQAGGGRVGELVVERGFITRRQLLGAIRQHTYRLCRQAISWREGEYKFYQGEEVSFEPGLTPIPVAELLFQASRDLSDPKLFAGSFPEPESVFARSPGAFEHGVGTRAGERGLPALEGLGNEAEDLFARLDGGTSVVELAQATSLQTFEVTYFLHHWEAGQLIERVAAVAPPPPRPEVEESESDLYYSPVPELPSAPSRLDHLRHWWASRFSGKGETKPIPLDWFPRLAGVGMMVWLVLTAAGFPAGLVDRPAAGAPALDLLRPPAPDALAFHRIHQGAEVFFLLHGRYPEELEALAALDLLAAPGSSPTARFSSTAVSYVALVETESGLSTAETGTIGGNFLLDPDFGVGEIPDQPPLILLD